MRCTKTLVSIFAVILVGVVVIVFVQKLRALAADRELAALVPQIASIALYDVQSDSIPLSLDSTPSVSFPVQVFTRAATSAASHGGVTLWKGSSLAVITLRDGTQRRARFSYYGGFFSLEGVSRHFTIRGDAASEFQEAFNRLIQEQFVPRRHEQNGMPNRVPATD